MHGVGLVLVLGLGFVLGFMLGLGLGVGVGLTWSSAASADPIFANSVPEPDAVEP